MYMFNCRRKIHHNLHPTLNTHEKKRNRLNFMKKRNTIVDPHFLNSGARRSIECIRYIPEYSGKYVFSWKFLEKSKDRKNTGNFYRRFFLSTFIHIILPNSTCLHIILPISTCKSVFHVEICKIM